MLNITIVEVEMAFSYIFILSTICLSLLNTPPVSLAYFNQVTFETQVNPTMSENVFEAPLQNSDVQEDVSQRPPGPPSSQVTLSLSPDINTTINDIGNNDEIQFFANQTYKKLYHKLHKSLIKVEKSLSRIFFLNQCLKLDILPPTIAIKANHNDRYSLQGSETFQRNLRNLGIENLRLSINEEKKHVDKCKAELRNIKCDMHRIITEAPLHSYIEERILKEKSKLKKQFYNHHHSKIIFLLKKGNKAIPRYLLNTTQTSGEKQKKKNRKFVKNSKYRRKIKKLNRKTGNLVTNYSKTPLTEDMENLLNRGLSFSIMPKKVNTTNIHAGFEKLSLSMQWKEKLTKLDEPDQPNTTDDPKTKFSQPWIAAKTTFPPTAPSTDLSTFLNGSLACVLSSDLNKAQTNLPQSEKIAMKQLIDLQKSREITIKPNDKTGGTSILNTEDYIKSMHGILDAKFMDGDGHEHPYFQKLDPYQADQLQFNDHNRLKSEVQNAKNKGWIDDKVAKWLVPEEPSPGRLYGLVKDHVPVEKWPEGTNIPPLRPVESASGTTFENASHFVDLHSNDLVKSLPSYWEDTPDMLRDFEKQNNQGPQPAGAIPVTLDITSLYTNIPLKQGIDIFEAFLNTRQNKSVPTQFLVTLLTLVLTCNILIFDNVYYLQRIGTAMGTRVAPTFACLFMGCIEMMMLDKWKGTKPKLYRRYIDDIFFVWTGDEAELLQFIDHLNKFHPFLKFKASYNFETRSVDFLDTIISITNNNLIKTNLYEKAGKKCSYLITSSCHPKHNIENIPYSLALRLKRICSDNLDFIKQLENLREKLLSRGYKNSYISKAFERVKPISRTVALQKVKKEVIKRPILRLQYDPRLPNISNILYRFWKVMTVNPIMKKIFPEPPMVCWTRPKNLREYLIRAKLPREVTVRRSRRNNTGFRHCDRDCIMCKFSPKFIDHIVSSVTKEKVPIQSNLTCVSKNVIYSITCTKQEGNCKSKPQYIGQTKRRVCDRFSEHKNSIKKDSNKPVGKHFSIPGHQQCDLQIIPFEEIRSKNPFVRLSREKFYIRKLNPELNVRY